MAHVNTHLKDTTHAQEHELRFSSKLTILLRPLALPFKTGDSRARVKHASGF